MGSRQTAPDEPERRRRGLTARQTIGWLLDFARELKRRKVYRVTVVYVVVAAGAIELLDVVIPATRLPPWADELFLGLALLGLPVTVVLAWAYDVTPEGVRRDRGDAPAGVIGDDGRGEPPSSPVPAGGPGDHPTGSVGSLDPCAVALLPFENLTPRDEAEAFATGLHHDLHTELARVSALSVIARTSVMDYRGSGKRASVIGRELGVGTVVEGAVQQAEERVRLNVQVVDARTDIQRSGQRYDRELSAAGLFDLQGELAEAIARTLRAELTPEEVKRVRDRRRPTESLDAYRLFSEGRALLDRRTRGSLTAAIERFREAKDRDPEYGLAWAGLARGLGLLGYYDYALPEGAPDAMEVAERAVDLAPDAAEAHTSLAIIQALRHEGPAARERLRKALRLRPSDAEALIWLAWLLLVLGEAGSAPEPARRAAALNPRAPAVHVFLAVTLLAVGDFRTALDEARHAMKLQPDYDLGCFVEALALYHLRRPTEARPLLERLVSRVRPRGSPSSPEVEAVLALVHLAAGDEAEARRIQEWLQEHQSFFAEGLVLAAFGRRDAAFDAFERVDLWGSFETEHVRYFFPDVLGPLRRDRRYRRLLSRVDRDWGIDVHA